MKRLKLDLEVEKEKTANELEFGRKLLHYENSKLKLRPS
jgi:hypothetical protein